MAIAVDDKKLAKELDAFELLFSHVCVLLYCDPEESPDTVDVNICF